MLYTCKVEGCLNIVHKTGALFHYTRRVPTSEMCAKHRMAFHRYGNPLGQQLIKQMCNWCGNEFEKKRKAKYCSKLCTNKGVSQERTANGKNRESVIKYIKNNPEKARSIWNRYKHKAIKSYPEKFKARYAAQNNIPIDKCIVCNTNENIHRHHHNYNLPLDITFLCESHHRELHAW